MSRSSDFRASYGPWALVTGASSGIGEQFARQLARRGLNVLLVARRRERLDALAGELSRRRGPQAEVIAVDLGEATAVDQVLTAVAIRYRNAIEVDLSSSRVTLRRLAAAEIERYVQTGEPLDKAGSYALQGRAAAFVARIEGSYSGVVGLPLCETATLLARVGVHVL